ncbi:MAG: hypothetical protein GTN76_12630 [Candidatus Aenigmarchaeota archaeon]|nr:hypothetical protein [Candidatus Aenigmarchaeota archaeon]
MGKEVKITPNGNYFVVGSFREEDGCRYLVLERSTEKVYVAEKILNIEDHGHGVVTDFDSMELFRPITHEDYQSLLKKEGTEILPLVKSPDGENTFSVYGINLKLPKGDEEIDVKKLKGWKKYPGKESEQMH